MAYLNHLLDAFGGDEHLALAGWYQGERAVRTHGPYKVSKVFVADVLALAAHVRHASRTATRRIARA